MDHVCTVIERVRIGRPATFQPACHCGWNGHKHPAEHDADAEADTHANAVDLIAALAAAVAELAALVDPKLVSDRVVFAMEWHRHHRGGNKG